MTCFFFVRFPNLYVGSLFLTMRFHTSQSSPSPLSKILSKVLIDTILQLSLLELLLSLNLLCKGTLSQWMVWRLRGVIQIPSHSQAVGVLVLHLTDLVVSSQLSYSLWLGWKSSRGTAILGKMLLCSLGYLIKQSRGPKKGYCRYREAFPQIM